MMNTRYIVYFFAAATIGSYSAFAAAQPNDNADDTALDVTMEVVEERQGPDSAVTEIALPVAASEEGVQNSAEGLATANDARARGREFGEDQAEQARADARQNIQDNIPGGDLDDLPDDVYDNIPDDVRDRLGPPDDTGQPGGS